MSLLTRLPVFRTVAMLQGHLAESQAQVRALRDKLGTLNDEVRRLDGRDRTLSLLETPVLDRRRLSQILTTEGREYQDVLRARQAVVVDELVHRQHDRGLAGAWAAAVPAGAARPTTQPPTERLVG